VPPLLDVEPLPPPLPVLEPPLLAPLPIEEPPLEPELVPLVPGSGQPPPPASPPLHAATSANAIAAAARTFT
jgi:hypothetical protein